MTIRELMNAKLAAGALTAALLVAAAGLPAHAAQPQDEEELQGSFDQPLDKGGESGPQSKTVIQSSDGNDTYKIEISGNKVKAWHNDKALPKDRVRRTKDKVEILDADKNVVKSFPLGGQGMSGVFGLGEGNRFSFRVPGGPETPQPPEAPRGSLMIQNAPPVMLGINMSDADEDTLEELNQKDVDEGVVVDRVIEGLPADKAGVQTHDVIVEINGERPINSERLRELLSDRKAGDELAVKLFRDGKPQEVRIRLEKFDPQRLGVGQMSGEAVPHFQLQGLPDVLKMYGEGGKGQWEEARKAIEKAMKELRENENLKPEKIRGEATKALEQAMKALREAEAKGQMQWRSFMDGDEDGRSPRAWMWSDKPGQLYTMPPQPPAARGDGETSRKLDRLADQLDRLNSRLDELERRLDGGRERNR